MVTKKDTPDGTPTPADATTPATAAHAPASGSAQASADTTVKAEAIAPGEVLPPHGAEGESAAPAAPVLTPEQISTSLIRKHVLVAAATAAIPVVFLDSAALAAVQLNLLRDLSKVYGVEFRSDLGSAAIGTLLATIAPATIGGSLLGSYAVQAALQAIPVFGPTLRLLTQPAFNAAFTYALGKVFEQHFASGGTFLTFDPAKVKAYFVQKYQEVRGKGVQATAAAAAA